MQLLRGYWSLCAGDVFLWFTVCLSVTNLSLPGERATARVQIRVFHPVFDLLEYRLGLYRNETSPARPPFLDPPLTGELQLTLPTGRTCAGEHPLGTKPHCLGDRGCYANWQALHFYFPLKTFSLAPVKPCVRTSLGRTPGEALVEQPLCFLWRTWTDKAAGGSSSLP